MYYARFPHWSPDSGSLIVVGRDLKGRQGIFQVDVHTGQPALVVQGANSAASPRYSADGKRIFWVPRGDHVLRERHLSTGTERDVFRDPRLREGIYLSPDGGAFAVTTNVDPTTRTSKVLLVPVNGGTPRELFRLTVPEGFSEVRCVAWTPDGKALLIQKATVDPVTFLPTVEGHSELWKVSVSTGESHKMNIDVDAWIRGNLAPNELGFTLSPDGRRIAFLMGKHGYEVWALENVVPRQTARK
jgi:Tol biopolymer transport system component